MLSLCFLSLLAQPACRKKQHNASVRETTLAAYTFELTILRGRRLDSLASLAYEDRLLAYALELGLRSRDFNQRLGLIISASSDDIEWTELVTQVTGMENYKQAEEYNLRYLDSLAALCHSPTAPLTNSFGELRKAHHGLIDNYATLRNLEEYSEFLDLLSVVLANEQTINQALLEAERTLRQVLNNGPLP